MAMRHTGVTRIRENLSAAKAVPQTLLGKLRGLP